MDLLPSASFMISFRCTNFNKMEPFKKSHNKCREKFNIALSLIRRILLSLLTALDWNITLWLKMWWRKSSRKWTTEYLIERRLITYWNWNLRDILLLIGIKIDTLYGMLRRIAAVWLLIPSSKERSIAGRNSADLKLFQISLLFWAKMTMD